MRTHLVLLSLFVSACGQTASGPWEQYPAEATAEPSSLEDIESRVTALEQLTASMSRVALIEVTGDSGYSVIDTAQGPIFFVLEEVRVQGDGQAITLRVGNPSAASLSGLRFGVSWGPRFGATREEGAPPLAPIEQRRKQVSASEELRAGSWTFVRFNIGPIRSEDFGMLVISDVTVEQVSLQNPR